jgi:hypothetical protein
MQKTLNKIWTVLTLGMVCILIFCVFANGALKRSKEALEKISAMEKRLDLITSASKATDFRIEKLERSISEMKETVKSSKPPNHDAIGNTSSNDGANEGAINSNRKPLPIGINDFAQNRKDSDTIPAAGNQTGPVLSIAQQQLEAFRSSLNEEQLIELSNRVENAVVESFSTASKLANFSEEQKLQIIESMGIEQLDFIRNTQEKSILMQMMTEHATREISEHR